MLQYGNRECLENRGSVVIGMSMPTRSLSSERVRPSSLLFFAYYISLTQCSGAQLTAGSKFDIPKQE
jgi:hypothetical protein